MFKLGSKTGIIALIALLAMAAPALAVEFGSSINVEVANMDLWRGLDASADSDYVVIPTVDLEMKGLWTGTVLAEGTMTLDENGTNPVNEVHLAYSLPLNIGGIGANVTAGNIFYFNNGAENNNEAFVEVSLDTYLAPTFAAYYDYDQAESAGMFYTLGVSDSVKVAEGVTVTGDVLVSYNQESDSLIGDYSDFHNAELALAADWTVTDQLTISPNVAFSTPLSNDAENIAGVDDEARFGVNFAVNF